MRYICNECGCVFDDDEAGTITEYEGEGVMRGPIYYSCCPECRSEDFSEAKECDMCGEYAEKEDGMLEVNDFWFCLECAKDVHDAYAETMAKRKAWEEKKKMYFKPMKGEKNAEEVG